MKNKAGFTLVELSIVIIIIGLIVSGVVAGQSLVQQAKLRSMMTDKEKYSIALNTFKLEYDALPGDMPNAKLYWPTSGNGNGNGWIEWVETVTGEGKEWLRAFEHLSQAKLVSGSYSYSDPRVIGETHPDPAIGEAWLLGGSTDIYGLPANNQLVAHSFSSKQAFALDSKADDGNPTTGRLLALAPIPFVAGCMDADWTGGPNSANYVLTSDVENCRVFFVCYQNNCAP